MNAPDLFADLDTDPMTARTEAPQDIKDLVHVANGGNASSHPCIRCNGRGSKTYGYVNIKTYPCSACHGTGRKQADADTQRTRSAAFKKGEQTKAQKLRERAMEFGAANRDLITKVAAISEWNSFASSLMEQYASKGEWSANQIAAVNRMLDKIDATNKAKREAKAKAGGDVEISAIQALFDTATGNGLKRPIFRTEHVVISMAPAHGRNAGALYVKYDKEYAGKIMGGKFLPVSSAPADTLEIVQRIAKDPAGEAVLYGKRTGICGCCGAELTNKVSIERGIGPICASKWGF